MKQEQKWNNNKRYENANVCYRFLKANHLRIKFGRRLKYLDILVGEQNLPTQNLSLWHDINLGCLFLRNNRLKQSFILPTLIA